MLFPNSDLETTATEIAPQIRVLQIIHLALMGGVMVYFALRIFQVPQRSVGPLTLVVPIAGAAIVMSFVVPIIVRRSGLAALQGKSPVPAASLMNVFQRGHIIGIALLEGAGFLVCSALTTGLAGAPRWLVAIPVAVIVLLLVRFPRQGSVVAWISAAREKLAT